MRGVTSSAENERKLPSSTLSIPSKILLACSAILSVHVRTRSEDNDQRPNEDIQVIDYPCTSGKFVTTEGNEEVPCSEAIYRHFIGTMKALDVSMELNGTRFRTRDHCIGGGLKRMFNSHLLEVMGDLRKIQEIVGNRTVVERTTVEDGGSDVENEQIHVDNDNSEERVNSCLKALGQASLCRLLFAEGREFDLLKWGLRRPTIVQQYDALKEIDAPTMTERLDDLATEIERDFGAYRRLPSRVLFSAQRYQSLLQYMYLKMFSIILGPANRTVVSQLEWLAAGTEAYRLHELSDPGSPPELILNGLAVNTWRQRVRKALEEATNEEAIWTNRA